MLVKLKYRTKDGKQYSSENITVKQAKTIYKNHAHLKSNNNIVKVWLSCFIEGCNIGHEILKDLKNKVGEKECLKNL